MKRYNVYFETDGGEKIRYPVNAPDIPDAIEQAARAARKTPEAVVKVELSKKGVKNNVKI